MATQPAPNPSSVKSDDIAIVGLACRFPGEASNEAGLWELLSKRKSAYTEVPSSRFNADAYHHPSVNKLNTLNNRGAHFMQQDVAAFDAPFFGITAQEANAMDPAARMLLEVTFEALENAGVKLEDVAGSDTSCYVGCFTRDYHEMLYRDIESAPMYTGTGTGFSLFSNRISWFYDLRGPSMTLDTACSSSLVGLHLACRGLQSGESKMAVVCGANVILSPDIALTLSNLHMLSTDGLSRSFAEGTTGYGRGEGISSLILKRVDDALRDGDPIRAVVRGSGVNQDGHTKGITLPNSEAQADLINTVYSSAGLESSDTGYFEAHGTGTAVGDPLELGAIAKSISRARKTDNKLLVGSIKSNVGHLEGSAGLAGVIKCVLMLEKNVILPNIHFDRPNRRVPFDQWRIKVPTALMPWPNPELRRASINSFGYGGTNAHVVIDDTVSYLKTWKLLNRESDHVPVGHSPKHHLILLSARDEAALDRLKYSYSEYFASVIERAGSGQPFDEKSYLNSLAYTLGCRRSVFPRRSFVVASSLQELKGFFEAKKLDSAKTVAVPRIGFVFTGQGAQWARMGLELMAYPVFAHSVQEADRYFSEELHCTWSVLEELGKSASESQIELAEFSQPLSTVLQVALVDHLSSWNILPATVVGHSSGEIAAAYSYGAITKQDAWKISYWRGKLCAKLPSMAPDLQGSMMAVGLGPEDARSYVDAVEHGKVVIACVNSPSSVTLSGDQAGIDEILVALKSQNIFARKLKVSNAYHSHHMQILADEYLRALEDVTPHKPEDKGKMKMASSVTGKCVTYTELGPSYWVQNLISPVLFSEAVATLLKQPTKGRRQARATEPAFDYLLEIGPHAALKGPLRQILQAHTESEIPYSSLLVRGGNDSTTALAAAGALFCHGTQIDIEAINRTGSRPCSLTDLPHYPWNHSLKYWADSRISRARQSRKSGRHDLFGAPMQDSDELEPRWRHFLRVSDNPWIRDHVVHSTILYPGSGILAMPLHALQTLADPNQEVDSIQLRDVHIVKAIVVPDDRFGLEVFLRLRRQRPRNGEWTGWWEFSVCSNQENDRVEEHGYGLGKVHYSANDAGGAQAMSEKQFMANKFKKNLEIAEATSTTTILPKTFYDMAESVGLSYGPCFQGLSQINVGKGSCTWEMRIPDTRKIMPSEVETPHIIHPTTLDIVFHSLFAAVGNEQLDMQHAAVPIGLQSLTISFNLATGGGAQLKGISTVSRDSDRDILADIFVVGEQSDAPSIAVQGLRCRELPSGNIRSASSETVKAPVGYVVQKVDIDLLDANQLGEYISRQELASMHGPDEEISNYLGGLESAIITIVDLIAHKNPRASFLQFGGVTPNLSQRVLTILNAHDSAAARFHDISFLDQNKDVIDALATQFETLEPSVEFAHSEFQANSLPLGRKDNSIDLAFIGTQGPATHRDELISQIDRILKPGGKLLLIEPHCRSATNESDANTLSFQTLFQGSTKGSIEQFALSIATKEPIQSNEVASHEIVVVLPPNPSDATQEIALELKGLFDAKGLSTHSVEWPETVVNLERPCMIISLLEFSDSFITNPSAADYNALKTLVLGGKRLLWVAKGGDPIMQTAAGFIRSLSNENPGLDYCFVLEEESKERDASDIAKMIVRLLAIEEIETEYIVRNGEIHISRWAEKRELSALVGADRDDSHTATIMLSDAPGSLTLMEQESDPMSKALFITSEVADRNLLEDEVEVDVKSLVLSATAKQISVQSSWREAAGVVTATGSSSLLHVGDAVSFAYSGPISTKLRVNQQYCQALSRDVDFEAAVFHSITYPLVHHSLRTLAQLDSSKTVLIQDGGNVLGQAGAALAKKMGAIVYALVKNEGEGLLLQGMGIAADHLMNDNETYQPTTLVGWTGGHGFDAILNTSGGEEDISRLWLCMAPSGKFIDVSNNESSADSTLSTKPFKLGASFHVVDMSEYLTSDFNLYKKIRDEAVPFLSDQSLKNVPQLPAFAPDKIQEALKSVAAPAGKGRAILLFDQDSEMPIAHEVKNQLRLREDATFILAGGLGGLGRNLAKLMVDAGAKHLVFLSRSGPGSAAAQSISDDFGPRGITVGFYSCDVADAESVSRVFATIADDGSWPPVRGIIQSAAVLRDSIFENMTHTQWMEAIKPKVQGTWNLHQASLLEPCAKEGLDFFVMLASISGFVGNRGQANYAAGNSYQDALARHRRSLGLAATSVNLGLMQDIGLIAERGGQSNLNDDTVVPLTIEDFNLIFKVALNSEAHNVPAQIITGLPTGGILRKKGIDTTPFYHRDQRFAFMRTMGVDASLVNNAGANDGAASSVEEQLAAAVSKEQATSTVLMALRAQVAKALRCAAEDIDATRSIHTYGMDSLMAVDMRGWVQTKLKAEISLFDVMSGSSIGMLAEKISKASKLVKSDLE
ncbi:putative polyketide synthase [Paraphoma chrysanthemicola]|uniref:Polyketide synthase n=1 Tax=Paraphoma chrysanthemicola TaxID=798071 RepID=A0A8K0RD12_9PLEO|nr:putative polyketide synthase [Paraphoma chrysanthemicola]